MTFGTEQKRHILTRYARCRTHKRPDGVKSIIADGTPLVKTKDPGVKFVGQYMHNHILERLISDIKYHPEVDSWTMVLDRGGNVAKALFAHSKRDKHTVPIGEPPEHLGGLWIPQGEGDYLPQDWEGMIANRQIARREIYPLFYRALIEIFEPKAGMGIVLDGPPDRPIRKADYDAPGAGPELFKRTYYNRTLTPDQMINGGFTMGPDKKLTRLQGVAEDETLKHECTEGDLSAFVHLNHTFSHAGMPHNANREVLLDTGDGDTLMIALLHSRERINPVTGKFLNRVWVRMRGNHASLESSKKKKAAHEAAQTKKAAEAAERGEPYEEEAYIPDVIDGRDIYVNVNILYKEISEDPELRLAQYPVLTAVYLYILSGTNFFDDFAGEQYAIFHFVNWEKYIWGTWCKYAARFSAMIMGFYTGPLTFNQPWLLRRIYVNEAAVLTFYYQCYAEAHLKGIHSAYGPGTRITPEVIEEYTGGFAKKAAASRKKGEEEEKFQKRVLAAARKKIPPRNILVRYSRLAEGNAIYWINDYRPNGGHLMFNPYEEYKGLPYYGFIKDPVTGVTSLAPLVSPAKPLPPQAIPYQNVHKTGQIALPIPPAPIYRDGVAPTPAPIPATHQATLHQVMRKKNPLPGQTGVPVAAPAPQQTPPLRVKQPIKRDVNQAERLRKQREIEARKRTLATETEDSNPVRAKKGK